MSAEPGSDVDALVHRLFQLQEQLDPDGDPGDLTITLMFQDDMPLVEIWQSDRTYCYGRNASALLRQLVEQHEERVRDEH